MSPNIIEITNVSLSYGHTTILTEISLAIQKGTAVAITGQSGEGKTTLLSVMGLLQTATAGKITVDGQDTSFFNRQKQAAFRSRYFGYIFQKTRLISSLTALENVMLPACFAKTDRSLKKKAAELLERFDMQYKLDYKPQELSLGQLRRVALARSLLLDPAILLADEPTNNLNPALAKAVGNSLIESRDAGMSIIFVTHDRELAAKADQIFQLRNGKLYQLNSAQAML